MSTLKAAFFIKNIPPWERALRFLIGLAAVALGIVLGGPVGWIALASGAMFTTTAVFGFCPMCALVGRRLASKS